MDIETLIEKALTTDDGLSKMKELVAMQQEALARSAKASFFAAKSKMQAALPVIKKLKRNAQTNSMYASLDDVALQITPTLEVHGFSFAWDQTFKHEIGMVTVTCTLTHVDGHQEHNTIDAMVDVAGPQGKSNKTQVQGTGSTITYLRRYTLTGVVGVATADHDIDGRIPNVTQRQQALGVTNSNTINALAAPTMTVGGIMDELLAAVNLQELNAAGKLINALPESEQDEVKATYFSMRDQFIEA